MTIWNKGLVTQLYPVWHTNNMSTKIWVSTGSADVLLTKAISIIWTSVDLKWKVFSGIQMGVISQKVFLSLIIKMGSETMLLKLLPGFLGAIELMSHLHWLIASETESYVTWFSYGCFML